MTNGKVVSASFSMTGWDWKKFLAGLERPLTALITATAAYFITADPALASIIGGIETVLHSIIKYYVLEYTA